MSDKDTDLFESQLHPNANVQVDEYGADSIQTVQGLEHIRLRPGMYIGKLGDGSHSDDGIYVLLKEVLDNSIDEFRAGYGKQIEITREERTIKVRDYGRGIPLEKMIDAVSIINTSGKFNDNSYKKSVGLNGVGMKATCALSTKFVAQSVRDGVMRRAEFFQGNLVNDSGIVPNAEKLPNGTTIEFTPDDCQKLFVNYQFRDDYVEQMVRNFSYLNVGLAIFYQGKKYFSKNGLLDLLNSELVEPNIYPIIHLKTTDIEVVITHCNQQYGESFSSFVNGQHTRDGGTHQAAFRESIGSAIKEFYGKNMELNDIRSGVVAAIAVGIATPVFESQTKTKLGSIYCDDNEQDPDKKITVKKFVSDFVKSELNKFLHKNPETAEILLHKIQDSEAKRKEFENVTKKSKAAAKRISIHNDKLRDCRIHFNDPKRIPKNPTKKGKEMEDEGDLREDSCIFLTEGLSASGSITKCRDVMTQAVFSLRGKPYNSFGHKRDLVYKNEEFNTLQAALNIEDGLENLRYNKVIIATDADVDGMHIRLLLLTFFLQFFPELVRKGHIYILQTPLFRVRDKKQTFYCYSDEERIQAIQTIGVNNKNLEITRFKGLGEISSDEFKGFIGETMRLDQVQLRKDDAVFGLLRFYMGNNTPERLDLVVNNLVVEEDRSDEDLLSEIG
ncbi:MAG: toprim domain-containing protein [Paludibacteraceae bacterium]|nr:ATP-binding protein [Candidatus Physcocola equi]MCQ2233903.1 toprim domain-containing protein [Paludibacteraceae bacterium]